MKFFLSENFQLILFPFVIIIKLSSYSFYSILLFLLFN